MQRWQAGYATCFDAPLPQLISKHNQFVCHKKRGEDRLIVSLEPVGKINVEVVCSLACEAGGQVCRRTPTTIQGEYTTLNDDKRGHDHGPVEAMN
jgi:hypothetical protein